MWFTAIAIKLRLLKNKIKSIKTCSTGQESDQMMKRLICSTGTISVSVAFFANSFSGAKLCFPSLAAKLTLINPRWFRPRRRIRVVYWGDHELLRVKSRKRCQRCCRSLRFFERSNEYDVLLQSHKEMERHMVEDPSVGVSFPLFVRWNITGCDNSTYWPSHEEYFNFFYSARSSDKINNKRRFCNDYINRAPPTRHSVSPVIDWC